LFNFLIEKISLVNLDLWENFLNGAVHNTYHILMLTDLATPDKVHNIIWEGCLFGKENNHGAATFNDFNVSVFTENDLENFLI
jgi:hypothetical protein